MHTIGIIGTGFMGSSLIGAIQKRYPDIRIGAVEKDSQRLQFMLNNHQAKDYSADPAALFRDSQAVILAVKPRDLNRIAAQLPEGAGDTPVISVLAGTSSDQVAHALQASSVVRIMPNLAAEIGRAVIGITFPPTITPEMRGEISGLLESAGSLVEVDESLMPTMTALSGSGIAFAFQFIDALAMGAVSEGLTYAQAVRAAADVVSSAAALIETKQVHPQEMVSRVCSPAGTTIAGIRALADGKFHATVMNAVEKSARAGTGSDRS
ncbi:MAG: pyrroline-5-carboxylate reductase [Alkalispirochaeta sp.]